MSPGRVIVVGAGPSGLAAAFRLQEAGHSVLVLERADYVGGKMKTVVDRGFTLDTGASILPSSYANLLGIIRDAGLAGLLRPGGTIAGFARGGEIHHLDSRRLMLDGARTRLISTRTKLALIKLAIDNVKIRRKLSYEDITLAADDDTETAADYARRRLGDEAFDYLVDAMLRGLLGTSGEVNSKIDFFFSFNKILGSGLHFLSGGMSSYATALGARSDVRLEATVTSVEDAPGGVRVTWTDVLGQEHVEAGDACVVACAAPLTAQIVPGLPVECLDFLRSVRYTTSVSLNVALHKPPAGNPAFVVQIPRAVHPDLFGITLDHNKAPGCTPPGRGLLGLYTMSDWAEQLMDSDDAVVTDRILAAAESVIPGVSADVDFVRVNRWHPVVVYSRVGLYRELREFNARLPRGSSIHLAGDYFSCSNLNTATAAGERAARDIDAALGARRTPALSGR